MLESLLQSYDMSGGIDKDTVTLWSEQAQTTLQDAQNTCTKAQTLLQSTTYRLVTQLPDKLQFATFMMDALKQQHEILTAIVESLKNKVREDTVKQFKIQVERDLTPAMRELDKIVLQLKDTKVPNYLINGAIDENDRNIDALVEDRTLCDFISTDAIGLLKANIDIYKSNCTKIHVQLEQTLQEDVLGPYNNSIVKTYHKITKHYEELTPVQLDVKLAPTSSPFKSHNLINTILKENASLENELVPILEMLTNHYDQCVQGTLFFNTKSTTDADVNFEVLQNDALELPDVLKELNTMYDIIINNEKRAKKLVHTEFSRINSLVAMIRSQLKYFRSYKAAGLTKFMLLTLSTQKVLYTCSIPTSPNQDPIVAYTQTINQLAYHYVQFLSVYKSKYLSELFYEKYTYPREYLFRLTDFLNNELLKLQQEETERRKQWLAKYGDFIPTEFKLPGKLSQPAVVHVVTEGLEEVQKELHDGEFHESAEEANLSNLIKTIK